jgi:hypothetical protein
MPIETAAELCLVLGELGHEVELMWHPAGVGGPDAGSHHRQTSRTTRPRPGSVTHLHRERARKQDEYIRDPYLVLIAGCFIGRPRKLLGGHEGPRWLIPADHPQGDRSVWSSTAPGLVGAVSRSVVLRWVVV